MLISHSKRFLFIHIQKTAGTSIGMILKNGIPDLVLLGGTHDTASQAMKYLAGEYDNYFTAAFVRNPWSRLVSWYAMITQQSRRLSWWQKVRQRQDYIRLWQYVHENSRSFEEFIKNCTDEIRDIDGVKSFWRNQIDYISDRRGDVVVDFVGRYETLTEDARQLFKYLGLPELHLPCTNQSQHHHYSAYYTDELADLVAQGYARDIEAFGYRFERVEQPLGPAVKTPVPN